MGNVMENTAETASAHGNTQWYIGAVNGIVICVDKVAPDRLCGRFFHSYSEEAVHFESNEQMLFQIEQFLNSLNFPHPTMSERTFLGERHETNQNLGRTKIMTDKELLSKHGDIGTFIVRVQHRQNSSWQGQITWMEQDETVYFRSAWEMLKLIEEALNTVTEAEDEGDKGASWF